MKVSSNVALFMISLCVVAYLALVYRMDRRDMLAAQQIEEGMTSLQKMGEAFLGSIAVPTVEVDPDEENEDAPVPYYVAGLEDEVWSE